MNPHDETLTPCEIWIIYRKVDFSNPPPVPVEIIHRHPAFTLAYLKYAIPLNYGGEASDYVYMREQTTRNTWPRGFITWAKTRHSLFNWRDADVKRAERLDKQRSDRMDKYIDAVAASMEKGEKQNGNA